MVLNGVKISISEEEIRSIFGTYGEILNTTKKTIKNKKIGYPDY